jgi:hypothetical protein
MLIPRLLTVVMGATCWFASCCRAQTLDIGRALYGDSFAPGSPVGGFFGSSPHLGSTGVILYPGVTSGSYGYFALPVGGAPQQLVTTGQSAPGTAAGVYFETITLSGFDGADSMLAFHAYVAGPGISSANSVGIWRTGLDGTYLVARQGDPAPGLSADIALAGVDSVPRLSATGDVAVIGNLVGPGITSSNDRAIWFGQPGALALVAQTGKPATGTGTALISSFQEIRVSRTGHIALAGGLDTGGAGLWLGRPDAMTMVAGGASAPPGVPGATFEGIGALSLNDSDKLAFVGYMSGAGVGTRNDAAVFAGAANALRLVARRGDSAPGIASAAFNALYAVGVSEDGCAAFIGELYGPGTTPANRETLYFEGPGSPRLVARTGDIAPGDPLNRPIVDLMGSAVDAAGDIAFIAALYDPNWISGARTTGLWVWSDGQYWPVAIEGQTFDIEPGPAQVFRQVEKVAGIGWSGAKGINDSRELAFTLLFTDGTMGIFTTTIPEPIGAGAGMLVLACLLRRRREEFSAAQHAARVAGTFVSDSNPED